MSDSGVQTADYLITLLRCALKSQQPPEKPPQLEWEKIFKLADFHMTANLAFYAAERLADKPQGELWQRWSDLRDMNAVKSVNQLFERDCLEQALAAEGVRFVPLKGWYLKEIYPQDDFRTMSDLDILIDPADSERAARVMEELGYKFENECEHHASFKKPPYMYVEVHTQPVSSKLERVYEYYSRDPWHLAEKTGGGRHELSAEDHYVFIIAHFAKHFFNGGSGIRSVMDIYIFLQKYAQSLDREYVREQLAQMELCEFADTAEQLAAVWFDGKEHTEATAEMAEYVITSGVYGTTVRSAQNRYKRVQEKYGKSAGARYFLSRAFLPYREMKFQYPILKKLPILLPFCEIHRLINALLFKRDRVGEQLRVMKKS